MSTLAACSSMSGGPREPAASVGATVSEPATQQRYASLVSRLKAGDANAIAELEKFSAEHPDAAGPLVTLGIARSKAGDEPGALDYLQRATRVCGRCGPAWNEIGVLSRRQGRFADAEQAYLRAIELESTYAPAYYNLAVLYELYLPRPDLALQNYERYLQVDGAAVETQDVEKWVADLRRRVGNTPKTARADGTS